MIQEFQGSVVVVDAASPYVFIGHLSAFDTEYLMLEHADVHDLRDTSTSREHYVREAKMYGVHANRGRVLVRRAEIVGISLLSDVVE